MKAFSYLTVASAVLLILATPAITSANDAPVKHVALVFDDGPHLEQGPKMLELLAKEGVHVSFAQVATNMLENPKVTLAMQAAGHEIVNHSHDHKHPKDLTDEELTHEIAGAQAAITKIIGKAPTWYWPPFLEVDDRVRATLDAAGMNLYPTPHLVSSDDWDTSVTADQIRINATTNVQDATVILFHEWRVETLDQLPAILAELRKQNCKFLTFTELNAYHAKTMATR